MANEPDTLKEIHKLRQELTDIKGQVKRAPLQLKARQTALDAQKAKITEEKDAAKRIRMDADGLELNLKQSESRIADLKVKLNSAESNKEYSAIKEEIDRISKANDTLQDEILTKLSSEEEKRGEIRGLEQKLDEDQKEFEKFKEVVDYKVEKLKGQIEIVQKKIAELEPKLGSAAGDYLRLTKLKGDDAIAACDQGTCQACFSAQPPQSWNELLVGRCVKCVNCGALLYKA